MIITRTPFRVSFFGGGTDYPTWFRLNGGEVLSATIDKYCRISVRSLPPFFEHKHRIVYSKIECVGKLDEIAHPSVREVLRWSGNTEGLEIHHDGDLPARSGLGSSSAFTVGLLHALAAQEGKFVSKSYLATNAINIEQNIIKENVGSQDQVAVSYGGLNHIKFNRDETFSVSPVTIPTSRLHELEDHLLLFFTGITRIASETAAKKIQNIPNKTEELKLLHQHVAKSLEILHSGRAIEDFGEMMNDTWRVKRQLAEGVTNPIIDKIYSAAKQAGAIGGKIIGAGGGGFMLVFAEPKYHKSIRNSLSNLVHVPFKFENEGSKVIVFQPEDSYT